MKKLKLLVVPLVAISFLASCGNNTTNQYKITIDAGDGVFITGKHQIDFKVTNQINISSFVRLFTINPSLFGKTFAYYTYNDGSSIGYDDVVSGDVTLKANYFDITEPIDNLDDINWSVIKSVAVTNNNPSGCFAVGATKSVKVNKQDHEVRIIGFNHDTNINSMRIGITFEFANLISDEEGYSLVTQWNDTNDTTTANHDYLNSSIRRALTGEGNGHILWAQKGKTSWSKTYTDSVLSMLPSDLVDVLTAPKKTAKCKENDKWVIKDIISGNGDYDKLFLLSPSGVGYEDDRAGAYAYYQEPDEDLIKRLRIKKQVKGDDIIAGPYTITYNPESGQQYKNIVNNYAGYNCEDDETGGGYSWLRAPRTNNNEMAWTIGREGGLNRNYVVYSDAQAVAPAFCI